MNFLLIILALMPLAMAPSAFFPYISGKVLFLRFSITAVAVLFFVHLIGKKTFQEQMGERMRILIKNPIFLCLSAYFLVFVFSTFFAVNRYWAFFGSIERGEGVVGMLHYFGFSLFTLLLFQKKEWLYFFKLSMVTAVIFFVHAVIQYSENIHNIHFRPASFTGHPTFLAGYFIFVTFMAIIIFLNEKQNGGFWAYFPMVMVPITFLGVFLTRTRGVLIGLVTGFFVVIIYLAFFGKEIKWKGINLRKLSVVFMFALVLFGGVFIFSRQSLFWQKIPGLNRLATLTLKDPTTQSRLLTYKVALRSVDPREGNMDKLLLGWGPDNFSIAWNLHYDPRIYLYDPTTLDRAHNKLLDTLVMHGIFGLLFYSGIWFFIFKALLVRGDPIAYRTALIFFSVSYFTQNLFVFDNVVTYMPFFAFLSYVVFLQLTKKI